jgi:hypothetical protein
LALLNKPEHPVIDLLEHFRDRASRGGPIGLSRDTDHGKEETKLIEAALETASAATAIAEAEIAKALGFELCKCQFPPIPMLTVGHVDNPHANMRGPVYECPMCGYNSAGPCYDRIAPRRATKAAASS